MLLDEFRELADGVARKHRVPPALLARILELEQNPAFDAALRSLDDRSRLCWEALEDLVETRREAAES